MKQALVLVAALAARLAAALFVFRPGGVSPTAQTVAQEPWQIEALPGGGSRVFGLVLAAAPGQSSTASHAGSAAAPAASTLADAQRLLGPSLQIGLLAAGDEPGTLEAYVDGVTAGFVTGKLVLVAELPADAARGLRARSTGNEPQPSGARRYALADADRDTALRAPIAGLSFLPSVRLDAAMVAQRFGETAQRLSAGGQLHLLYPSRGLVVSLDGPGDEPARAVIQYVAPARFELLRRPLLQAVPASATAR
ncbi:MAG: hypothetical protein MK041_06460 [Aquabacterium sp.]|nr:hypothetical protein [Aquabacterium sp.]